MEFTDGQLAIIKETARETARAVVEEYTKTIPNNICKDVMDDKIRMHGFVCPIGRMVTRAFWIALGFSIGGASAGSGITIAVLKLMGNI